MRRHPLLAYFALTFGLTWGLGACFALFPDLITETLLNRIDLPLEWSAQLNALGID